MRLEYQGTGGGVPADAQHRATVDVGRAVLIIGVQADGPYGAFRTLPRHDVEYAPRFLRGDFPSVGDAAHGTATPDVLVPVVAIPMPIWPRRGRVAVRKDGNVREPSRRIRPRWLPDRVP